MVSVFRETQMVWFLCSLLGLCRTMAGLCRSLVGLCRTLAGLCRTLACLCRTLVGLYRTLVFLGPGKTDGLSALPVVLLRS